jgi:hypothetical protein
MFVVVLVGVCISSRAHFLQLEQRGWRRAYIAVHSTLAHGGEGPLCSDCCRRHGVTTERFPRSLAISQSRSLSDSCCRQRCVESSALFLCTANRRQNEAGRAHHLRERKASRVRYGGLQSGTWKDVLSVAIARVACRGSAMAQLAVEIPVGGARSAPTGRLRMRLFPRILLPRTCSRGITTTAPAPPLAHSSLVAQTRRFCVKGTVQCYSCNSICEFRSSAM